MNLIPLVLGCFYEAPRKVQYPTTCGGSLAFSGGSILLRYSLSLLEPQTEVRVIQANSYVTDADGQTWRCTTHFTAQQLLTFFYAPVKLRDGGSSVTENLKDSPLASAVRGENILVETSLCDDTRDYRRFYVDSRIVSLFVKYWRCHFTIGYAVWPVGYGKNPPLSSNLALLLSSNLCSLANDRQDDNIALVVEVDPERLLFLNTAMCCDRREVHGEVTEFWEDVPIPLPIVFARTDVEGAAQQEVTYSAPINPLPEHAMAR